jgi:hypothetical protein
LGYSINEITTITGGRLSIKNAICSDGFTVVHVFIIPAIVLFGLLWAKLQGNKTTGIPINYIIVFNYANSFLDTATSTRAGTVTSGTIARRARGTSSKKPKKMPRSLNSLPR